MGKFNEYTQKATPADNDTLMIYDATSKANKLSPFSGIWNWIVGKLTNAVISNLQTSNKTVVGALNELYSKKATREMFELSNNIDELLNITDSSQAYFAWGTIGGLFPGWAWGVLMCAGGVANFIGISNDNKTLAAAHYENGAWSKISTWS